MLIGFNGAKNEIVSILVVVDFPLRRVEAKLEKEIDDMFQSLL